MNKCLQGIKVARVATTAFTTLTQLSGQLDAIHEAGGHVMVVAGDQVMCHVFESMGSCQFTVIPMTREIDVSFDLRSLFQLWRFFRKHSFDIVHSTTPKAGLLCAIAGKLAGVPIRLHTYTGQPWVTLQGLKKSLLRSCDRLISLLNTCCYADSLSQRDFLVNQKIVPIKKIKVLGSGSLAGVDLKRFSIERYSSLQQRKLRKSLGLKETTRIVLFVGRVTEDKGIHELLQAFTQIVNSMDVVLLIVGPFEKNIENSVRNKSTKMCGDKIIFTGFCDEPEKYIAIADFLCIPSYREGFGTVVIEAAAMGVPAIGTNIYGLTDAIVDGETGILIEPRNVEQLHEAMNTLLQDPVFLKKLGEKAKHRAITSFDSQLLGKLLVNDYFCEFN